MSAAATAIAKTNIPVPAIFRALNSLPTLPDNAQPMAVKTAFSAKHRLEYSGENKPTFRNGGNRQTGMQETALAA
ncbi:hypothetical protein [Fibrobacter sp.]|uniref:hypothetical protein n=1 Tax=Fibrobacter sp. TaxID=35828 RepID=UPI002609114D|nr:hypothetical protein [Fibrobacter sp.]MDD5943413.1 hypothetical protein [Fibrobacter sp.]